MSDQSTEDNTIDVIKYGMFKTLKGIKKGKDKVKYEWHAGCIEEIKRGRIHVKS